MQLFTDTKGLKTYGSPHNCRVAVEKVEKELGVEFRWVMGATQEGRYHPVILLREDDLCKYMHFFIRKGFCIAN